MHWRTNKAVYILAIPALENLFHGEGRGNTKGVMISQMRETSRKNLLNTFFLATSETHHKYW